MSLTEVCKSGKAETSEVNRSLRCPCRHGLYILLFCGFVVLCALLFPFIFSSGVIFNIYICCGAWALASSLHMTLFVALNSIWKLQDNGKNNLQGIKENDRTGRLQHNLVLVAMELVFWGKNCTEVSFLSAFLTVYKGRVTFAPSAKIYYLSLSNVTNTSVIKGIKTVLWASLFPVLLFSPHVAGSCELWESPVHQLESGVTSNKNK